MILPQDFTKKYKKLMSREEFEDFIAAYSKSRYFGMRVNRIKISVQDFLKLVPFKLQTVPWTEDGFIYTDVYSPGRHPLYYAGLYYIQEPTAMFPAEVLRPTSKERVLDLCAAPGGKTLQLAAFMKNRGLLVANDINAKRIKPLVKNIELYGVKNTVITNESAEKLAEVFPSFFDKILIDAPCSGEGMFRKDINAVKNWEIYKSELCSNIQKRLLTCANKMLKEDGRIVYSTCTFAPEENEEVIEWFLRTFPEYELIEIPKNYGICSARPEWGGGFKKLKKAARLWPHRIKGEGHFVALIAKKGSYKSSVFIAKSEKPPKEAERFFRENLKMPLTGNFYMRGKHLYMLPEGFNYIPSLVIVKAGWYLGQVKNGQFKPSHSMLMGLKMNSFRRVLNFDFNSDIIRRYLKGETIMISGERGYTAVCVNGYPVGWAKQTGNSLKNQYPKGWRNMGRF